MFMNKWDVRDAVERWSGERDHPVLGPAALTLANLMSAVDAMSDGWPYWQAPQRAATKLTELIEQGNKWYREEFQHPRTEEPTAAQLKKAYTPLKSFRTKRNCQFEIVEVAK